MKKLCSIIFVLSIILSVNTLVAFLAPAPCLGAATDFVETWESTALGNMSSDCQETCDTNSDWTCQCPWVPSEHPERIRIVTATDGGFPIRSGSKAVRVESRREEIGVGGKRRTNLQSRHGSNPMTWEGWWAVSTFDSDGPFDPGKGNTHISFHDTLNLGASPNRPLITEYKNGSYQYKAIRAYGAAGSPPEYQVSYCAFGCTYTVDLGGHATDQDRWNDWVYQLKYDPTAPYTGIYRIYKNGVLVNEGKGDVNVGLGFTNSGNYWYNLVETGYGTDSSAAIQLFYFDEIRRRTAADGGSYATACPTIHPKAPSVVYPTPNATDIPTVFTLDYDAYEAGYTDAARAHITDLQNVFDHYDSQFEISASPATTSTGAFASSVWSKTVSSGDLRSVDVGGLSPGTTYYVHARYRNTAGVDRDFDGIKPPTDTDDMYWGPWSTVTKFTTEGPGSKNPDVPATIPPPTGLQVSSQGP